MKFLWHYHVRSKAAKLWERLTMKVVWSLPKHWIKWASIRMIAHATQNEYGNTIVPELSVVDALKRWGTA